MEVNNGILICKLSCNSSLSDIIDSETLWLDFALNIESIDAMKVTGTEEEKDDLHTTIYTRAGESFIVDVDFETMFSIWKTHIKPIVTTT